MAESLPAMPRVKLGSQGLEVSALGLGCMGMYAFYGPPKEEDEMVKLIHHAVDLGLTFFDTADVYGPHIGKYLERVLWPCLKGLPKWEMLVPKYIVQTRIGQDLVVPNYEWWRPRTQQWHHKNLKLAHGEKCLLLSIGANDTAYIGTAIVMAQTYSKYKSGVIPRDWHLVRVLEVILENEACPSPSKPFKAQSGILLKVAVGKNIVWPDSHLE